MFDTQIVELVRPTVEEVFIQHGDVVRSVYVGIDYHGPLNDTDGINKGLWLGPEGAQTSPAGIIGSAHVLLHGAATIIDRGFTLLGGVKENLAETLQELHERKQELEQVKAEIAAIRDVGGPSATAEDSP